MSYIPIQNTKLNFPNQVATGSVSNLSTGVANSKLASNMMTSNLPTISKYPSVNSILQQESIKSGIDNSFILPLEIHKQYGVIDIPGIEVVNIEKSNHKDKKYAITVKYEGTTKTIHYGNSEYEQYHDRTPLKAFSSSDHNDEGRRHSYLARSSKITNKYGLAANDPFSANRYAIITLW